MFYGNPMLALWVATQTIVAAAADNPALLLAAIIGTGGISGLVTARLGWRKQKADEKARAAEQAVQIRTVAAEEAEAAMRIMGDVVEHLEREVLTLRSRVEACEDRWSDHAVVCPLFGGRHL